MRTGYLYTVAGNNQVGPSGDGGPARSAALDIPSAVTVDPRGNLLFSERGGGDVREVAALAGTNYGVAMKAGRIYTVAGGQANTCSGDGCSARSVTLSNAGGVALDAAGDLFVSAVLSSPYVASLVVPEGTGRKFGRSMTAGHIYQIVSVQDGQLPIAVDPAGDLFLTDQLSQRVTEVAIVPGTHFGVSMQAGKAYPIAGNGKFGFSGDGGPALGAELANPLVGGQDAKGDLFIQDTNNGRIREITGSANKSLAISGVVEYQSGGRNVPFSGALVQACDTSNMVCTPTGVLSAGNGAYSLTIPGPGTYAITAYPPPQQEGGPAVSQGSTQIAVRGPNGATGVNLMLGAESALPVNVSLNGQSGSIVTLFWGSPTALSVKSCADGVGFVIVSGLDEYTYETRVTYIPLSETPVGSGHYQATIPPVQPMHGDVSIAYHIDCSASALAPDAGPPSGGNPVSINGSGFTGATQVLFGSQPARDFKVLSDSNISATAPGGSGTVPVTVQTRSGRVSFPAIASYTYLSVDSVVPSRAKPGSLVTVTGSGLTDASEMYFGNVPVSDWTIESDTRAIVRVPAGVGTVNVSVETNNGGEATLPGQNRFTFGNLSPRAIPYGIASGQASAPTNAMSLKSRQRSRQGEIAVRFGKGAGPGMNPSWDGSIKNSFNQLNKLVDEYFARFSACAKKVPDYIKKDFADALKNMLTLMEAAGRAGLNQSANAINSALPPGIREAVQGWAVVALGAGGGGVGAIAWLFSNSNGPALQALNATLGRVLLAASAVLAGAVLGFVASYYIDCGKQAWPPPKPPKCKKGVKCRPSTGSGGGGQTKVDPSGTIEDTNGNPIAHAAVTVMRSDKAVGPFRAPPRGSPDIAPSVNPEVTKADGIFHWDVVAGYYKVQATRSQCSSPAAPKGNVVTTPPFIVPPPRLGLLLTMKCVHEKPPPRPAVTALFAPLGPGRGGNTIEIIGTGFTASSSVDFGSRPATSVAVISPTTVRVTAPPGTGTVDVRVTTRGGKSLKAAADRYTYVSVPKVSRVSPNVGPPSGNTVVQISGSGFVSSSSVSFGGTPASSVAVKSDTRILAVSPPGVGVVDVTVTTPVGTSTAGKGDRFTYAAAAAQLEISPVSVRFGRIEVGTSSIRQFTVSNTGGKPLIISKSMPPNSSGFSAVSTLHAGTTLRPGQSRTESVKFSPGATGPASAGWVVSGGGKTVHAAFTGTGVLELSKSWRIAGSATVSGPKAQLTPLRTYKAGSIRSPIPVSTGDLNVSFTAQQFGGTGGDGITLTLARPTTKSFLGRNGGGLGYAGIDGIAICLDTHKNAGEPSSNFVGIADGSKGGQPRYIATSTSAPPLRVKPVSVSVTVRDRSVAVAIGGTTVLRKSVTTMPPHPELLFTSSTGNLDDVHVVSGVEVT